MNYSIKKPSSDGSVLIGYLREKEVPYPFKSLQRCALLLIQDKTSSKLFQFIGPSKNTLGLLEQTLNIPDIKLMFIDSQNNTY